MASKNRRILVGLLIVTVASVAVLLSTLRDQGKEGILEAGGQVRGTEITVSSKLSGSVESLFIKEGQEIRAGKLMAEIDAEEIDARREEAAANVEVARDQLKVDFHRIHQAKAGIKKMEATLKQSVAELELAKVDYERYAELVESETVTASEFDEAKTRYESAQAKLDAAKNAKEEALATLQQAEAANGMAGSQLAAAKARLREIEAVVKETRIMAPLDGTVINKLVEAGELLAAGAPVARIIDLSDIYAKV